MADRNEKGHFAAGNKLGQGNPSLIAVAAYKDAFKAAITPQELQDLARKVFADACDDTGLVPPPVKTHARTMVVERLAGAVKVDVEITKRGVQNFDAAFSRDDTAAIAAITKDVRNGSAP